MALGPYEHLLEVEQVGEATIVRFKRRTILESAAIEAIGEHLLNLSGEEGRRIFLLNFRGVESLTSGMLGKFVALQRALDAVGGRLAFCCVDPFLMEIFKIVQVPQFVPIHSDEPQALQALGRDHK
jgi:anti-anti-sigma regulatory factor